MLIQSLIDSLRKDNEFIPIVKEPEFDDGNYKLLLTIREGRNGRVVEAKSHYGNIIYEQEYLYIIPTDAKFDAEMGKILKEIYCERHVRQDSETGNQE